MDSYFTYFSVPDMHLQHLSPLMGGMQQCSAGYTFGPVMREYYIIEYVLRGKGEYTANGICYEVKAGEAFIICPYEPHLLRADEEDPWEYVWVGFSCDMTLPKLLAENYVFKADAVTETFSLFADGAHAERSTLDYTVALYTMLAKLYAAEKQKSEKSSDPVDRAVEIIRREYATVTVQALADRLFLNRSYLGARFKKKTGKTPKEYIDEFRLSTAAKLMGELGYNATQASVAVGYSDAATFSRMFKKHYGKSPRESFKARGGKDSRTLILK